MHKGYATDCIRLTAAEYSDWQYTRKYSDWLGIENELQLTGYIAHPIGKPFEI